ncbi:hypothetical protein MKX08_002349 [Trichoderma sp. CBMAI-0020]|nr:hypothetical protein MKX08_002349 [Trichoderma sp. CBMAI-0020]
MSETSSPSRQKAARACAACQKYKRRCDKALPGCSLCTRLRRYCDYTNRQTENKLKTRIQELESLVTNHVSKVSPQTLSTPASSSQATGSLPASQTTSSFYPASLRFQKLFLDSDIKTRPDAPPPPSSDMIPAAALSYLSDQAQSAAVMSQYFETVHKWMPIISRVRLTSLADVELNSRPRADFALLLLTMKLIQQVPGSSSDAVKNPLYLCTKEFAASLDITGVYTLLKLQAQVLIAVYEMGHGIFPAAYVSTGCCVTQAMALGIHNRDAPQILEQPRTWIDWEERQRIWWFIVILERYVNSVGDNRPLMSADPQTTSHLPVDDDAWDSGHAMYPERLILSSSKHLSASPFARLAQASHLQGEVIKHCNDETQSLLHVKNSVEVLKSEKPNPVSAIGQPPSNIGKTFRVRGVPRGWTEDDLQTFLKEKTFSEPEIGSLAIEFHGRTQTATLTFQNDSSQLQEILTAKQPKIPLQLLPKKPTRSSSLVFDCDFDGITTLYAPPSQDHHVDLMAISGHAFGSFKERGGEHMWLRDALPYDITGEDDKPDVPISRIMIHGYKCSLQDSNSFQNLEDIGTSFHSSLRSIAIAGSFRPIILVAHSLGGLIVKEDENGNWKMTGAPAILVSKSSATHCRPWENGQQHICAMDRTHSEMVKFSSEDSEYEKVLGRLQSLVREARKVQEAREALKAQKRISQPTLSEQQQRCLKSLAFVEMQIRSQDIESAASGTCEWLLQHEAFEKWLELNQELLWIKGKSGSGKSTLLNYAFANQKHLLRARDSDLVLSFFFHGRGGDLQKNPLGFFRSLLHQILKQIPDCLSDLVETFENRCMEIGEYGEKWQWHPKELWFSLESSVLRILETRSVWLFVDALDECGEGSAKDLVHKFELLFKQSVALSACSNQLRICFSCRHYPILSSPGLAEVCLEKENRADIDTYVQSEMSSFREQIPFTVLDTIIERASGVFLWAQLVVKRIQNLTINGAGPNQIIAAVDSIPEDLESLYDQLIRGDTRLVHVVARYGIQGVMNVILQRLGQVPVEADSEDGNGRTPLSLAAKEGNTTIVEVLLATGQADVNSKDDYGQTPLSWAVEEGHEAILNLLQDYAQSHP